MHPHVSYYSATANPAEEHPPLTESIEADVCVIGAGIAGCSTALHLAERGYKVVLLEAHRVGWGASGRSGGQAIFGYACGQERLIQLVGRDPARQLWQFALDGLELLRERVARHRIDCDLKWGQMHVALKPRQVDELRAWQDELEGEYHYPSLTFLDRQQVEARLATRRYCAGLLDAGSGHLHPLNYTLGLAAAAQAAGVRIFEHTPAQRLTHGEVAQIDTPSGVVRARHVALCCNAYINGLEPRLRARIMPVGTYIVATERLAESRLRALIRDDIAVADINFVLDYFRCSRDHRLLFGGRVSYSGLDPFDTARATRRRMIAVFPQLADVRIDYAWGGYVDITLNRAPDFGRITPNVYYLQGFSGHGIALAGIAGACVAETIAGHAERFDIYERIRHRAFPGGRLLRMPALVLAMLYYRMRDWW